MLTQSIPTPLSPPMIGSLGQGRQFWGPGGDKYEFVITGRESMEGWFEEVLVPVQPDDTEPVDYTPQQLDFMIEAGPKHGVAWAL